MTCIYNKPPVFVEPIKARGCEIKGGKTTDAGARSSTNAHSPAIGRTTAATPTGMFASDAIFSVN
jgi:hypothetical protein